MKRRSGNPRVVSFQLSWGILMWRVLVVALFVFLARDYATSQATNAQVCHAFRILSVNDRPPAKELEAAVRELWPELASGLKFASGSEVDSRDVEVTIQSASDATEGFHNPAPTSNFALYLRYTVLAQRDADHKALQMTRRTLAGNWQVVAEDIVALVQSLCAASMAPPKSAPPGINLPQASQEQQSLPDSRIPRANSAQASASGCHAFKIPSINDKSSAKGPETELRVCPTSSMTEKPAPSVLRQPSPLTPQQREVLASARTIGVESQYRWLNVDWLISALTIQSKTSGLAVSFVPVRPGGDIVDATVSVNTADEVLWNIQFRREQQLVERQVVALRLSTANARMAQVVAQILNEANGKAAPAPPPRVGPVPIIDTKGRLFAGPFASQGDKLRLHLDNKRLAAYGAEGMLMVSIPIGDVLDASNNRTDLHYREPVVPDPGEFADNEMTFFAAVLVLAPSSIGKFEKPEHFLDIAWRDGDVVKTASFEVGAAKEITEALKSAFPDRP